NGGTTPTSGSPAGNAAAAKLTKARCVAAKSLNIKVNPQFGQLNYNQFLIVLATSPRVAPGLLSWSAWEVLRSADAVLAPAGHPLLPALDEAGIGYRVADKPESADDDSTVVWLADPGD